MRDAVGPAPAERDEGEVGRHPVQLRGLHAIHVQGDEEVWLPALAGEVMGEGRLLPRVGLVHRRPRHERDQPERPACDRVVYVSGIRFTAQQLEAVAPDPIAFRRELAREPIG